MAKKGKKGQKKAVKKCPQCGTKYTDATLLFCVMDRTPLEDIRKEAETAVLPEVPTVARSTKQAQTSPPKKQKTTVADAPKLEMSDTTWRNCAIGITVLGALLRFAWLAIKPFHHDEGVNGFFLTNLVRDGNYRYDPGNYHGPTLYFIELPFALAFGLNTIPVRIPIALFGLAMVVLALYFRRYLGNIGSLLAGLFVALSPGLVFISRYYIHEIIFVFLSFAIAASIVFFIEKREAGPVSIGALALILFVCLTPSAVMVSAAFGGDSTGAVWAWRVAFLAIDGVIVYFIIRSLLAWDGGRPIYFLLASACVSLYFATKETAFITLGTMMIACVSIFIWRKIAPDQFLGKHLKRSLIVLHVVAGVAILFYHSTVTDGFKYLYNDLLKNAWRPPEHFVFYTLMFVIAMALVVWFLYVSDQKRIYDTDLEEPVDLTWSNFRQAFGTGIQPTLIILAAAGLFAYLFVLFFTSFFTWAEGVWKAFEAYNIWTKTGNKEHAFNGVFAYLKWCMKLEGPIMIISLMGLLISVIKTRHRWAMFSGLWAFGLLAAYMIIPYKTPWLAISFILPMCLAAGYALGQLLESRNRRLRLATGVLTVASVAMLLYQTYQLNFVRYDDDQMGYVYAHTKRGYTDLIDKIKYYAAKSGKGTEAQIEIVSTDYWPMTWDLNKFTRAYFQGRLVDSNTAELIVSKKGEQDSQVVAKYSQHYKFAGLYPLRPGVDLVLLVRNDIADPDAQDVSKITTLGPLP